MLGFTIQEQDNLYITIRSCDMKKLEDVMSSADKDIFNKLEYLYFINKLLVDDNKLSSKVINFLKANNIPWDTTICYELSSCIEVIRVNRKRLSRLIALFSSDSDFKLELWDLYKFGVCISSKCIKDFLNTNKVSYVCEVIKGPIGLMEDKLVLMRKKLSTKIKRWQLAQRVSLPFEVKVNRTLNVIDVWHDHWESDVYTSTSGGIDSCVLAHLVETYHPNVPAVFCDTGLEHPGNKEVIKNKLNAVVIRPDMTFKNVLENYGYPVVSKETAFKVRKLREQNLSDEYRNYLLHGDERGSVGKLSEKWKILLDAPFRVSEQCCDVMKKKPFKKYEVETGRKPFIGTMTEESFSREKVYLATGCNAFYADKPKSTPLGYWSKQDVLRYIKEYNVPYSWAYGEIKEDHNGKLYTTGEQRTGCLFCMFGCHLEQQPNRFQRMAKDLPKMYDYCINKLGLSEILDYIGVEYRPTGSIAEVEGQFKII